MTSDSFGQSERKADIEDSSSVLRITDSQVLSSITAEPQALSSLDSKSLLGLSNISTESINALNVLNLPADAKLISTSSCYISDGFFVHEMTPTYQDTNSVGNVYFAMYTLWVGKTRELFFLHTMPDFDLETTDFLILTRSFNHKYLREIKEFESVSIHLRIKDYNRKFVTIEHKILNKDKQLIGKGDQSLMFVDSKNYALIDIPNQVMEAHLPFYYGDKSPKA
jgi:YbgC/YbaW family acyl-CoA thioester hydrolase